MELIIKNADFSENGFTDNVSEWQTAPTSQGYTILTESNFGMLSSTSTNYNNKYVHSCKEIWLDPGQVISVEELPGVTTRLAIVAYTALRETGPGKTYESVEALLTQGGSRRTIGDSFGYDSMDGKTLNNGDLPKWLKNKTDSRIWVVINASVVTDSSTNVNPTNTPEIRYRIWG